MVRIHGLCSFHNPYKPDYSLGQNPIYHIFPPTIYIFNMWFPMISPLSWVKQTLVAVGGFKWFQAISHYPNPMFTHNIPIIFPLYSQCWDVCTIYVTHRIPSVYPSYHYIIYTFFLGCLPIIFPSYFPDISHVKLSIPNNSPTDFGWAAPTKASEMSGCAVPSWQSTMEKQQVF